jgi:uncharacterized protein YcbK (DUF882 family)
VSDRITTHFTRSEFACRCGCGADGIDERLVASLETMREVLGQPLRVRSGIRCAAHNAAVGGAPGSAHLRGLAADVAVADGRERFLIVDLAVAAGFRRIGVARDFVHLDLARDLPTPTLWMY